MQEGLEIIGRAETPMVLRVALLTMLVLMSLLFSTNPTWLVTNRVLAILPIQRFKWKSETFLSSNFNRFGSIVSASLLLAVLLRSYYLEPQDNFLLSENIFFLGLLVLLLLSFLIKLGCMQLFFHLHAEDELGTRVIDFHFAFNQIVGILLFALLCFDVFYLRLHGGFDQYLLYGLGVAFLLRTGGHAILLLNNLSFPPLSVFIYLCAFEIAPVLLVVRAVFK